MSEKTEATDLVTREAQRFAEEVWGYAWVKAHAADLALMTRRPETTGGMTVDKSSRRATGARRRMLAAVHAGDGVASEASARLAYEPFRTEHDAPMMTVAEARAILKVRSPVTPDIDTGRGEAAAEPSIRVWAFHEARHAIVPYRATAATNAGSRGCRDATGTIPRTGSSPEASPGRTSRPTNCRRARSCASAAGRDRDPSERGKPMNTFAILRPKTPATTVPEDVVARLKRGEYVPAGTLTCADGTIPAWRSEATRGNLYLSFDTGEIYGCTSQAMCTIGHVFTVLDYPSLFALKGVDGGDVAIAVGEPERLSGVLLEALGKAYDPESLQGTSNSG